MFDYLKKLLPSYSVRATIAVKEGSHLQETRPEDKNGQSDNYPHIDVKKNGYSYCLGKGAGKTMLYALQDAKKSIKIISPFLSKSMIDELIRKISSCNIKLITSISEPYANNSSKNLKNIIYIYHDTEYRLLFDTVFFKDSIPRQANEDDYMQQSFNDDFVHQKMYIIDDKIVFLGSFNFTYPSVYKNFETSIIFEEPGVVNDIIKYFEELFTTDIIEKWDFKELGKIIYPNRSIQVS